MDNYIMNIRFSVIVSIIMMLALYRVLPHPPNVSPLAAMALFGGVYFADRKLAFIIPLFALVVSDLIIGLHDTLPFVYGAFAITVMAGIWLRDKLSLMSIAGTAIASSLLFFVVTNFGAWLFNQGLYPMTSAGLLQSYIAGIPFYANTLIGDLFFTALLFGGFQVLERNISGLVTESKY
jgi:hypothetical protein